MNNNSNINDKKLSHDNKPTVIITIVLLLILVIFFAGYSIANGPNFDKYTLESRSTHDDNFIIDDFDNQYSYLKNNEKDKTTDDTTLNTQEETITGEIGSKDKTFFENNFKDTISFKEPVINENLEIEKKEEVSNTENTEEKLNNDDNHNLNNNENKTNIDEENNIKSLDTKNPIIQNVLSYDNKSIDKNINEENPYIIQIATHNNKTSAQHIRDILILEGFNSYLFETYIDDKIKYRIRIGGFPSKRIVLSEYKKLLSKSKIKGIENSIILKRKY